MRRIINKIFRLLSRKNLNISMNKEFMYMALRFASKSFKITGEEKVIFSSLWYTCITVEFEGGCLQLLPKENGHSSFCVHISTEEEKDPSKETWTPSIHPNGEEWLKETIIHIGDSIPLSGQICCSFVRDGVCGLSTFQNKDNGFQIKIKSPSAIKAAFQSDCYSKRIGRTRRKRKPLRKYVPVFSNPISLVNAIKKADSKDHDVYNELFVEASKILAIRTVVIKDQKIKPTSKWISRIG